MGTIVRRKHTSRSQLGPYKRHELLFGEILYPLSGYTGYGDGRSTDTRSRGYSTVSLRARCRGPPGCGTQTGHNDSREILSA